MSLEETIDMAITIPSHIHAILAKNGIDNPLDTPLEIIELSSGRAFLSFGPLLTFVVHGKEWTHSAMAEAAQNEDDIKLLKGRIISLNCIKVAEPVHVFPDGSLRWIEKQTLQVASLQQQSSLAQLDEWGQKLGRKAKSIWVKLTGRKKELTKMEHLLSELRSKFALLQKP